MSKTTLLNYGSNHINSQGFYLFVSSYSIHSIIKAGKAKKLAGSLAFCLIRVLVI